MTREEALKIWLPVIQLGVENLPECKVALDMAIKALTDIDDIKTEIEDLPSELTEDGRRMVRRGSIFRIIDKHTSGKEIE